MANITDKVVTVPKLQYYKEKEDAYNKTQFVGQEAGKGLIETEKVTKLDAIEEKAQVNKVEGIQINGTDLVPDVESKVVNITAKDLAPDLEGYVQDSELTEQLTPYLKSTDAESTYLKSETAESTYLKSADAGTTYVKNEGFDDKVKGVVGSVYRPKGSKENLEAIKAVETPTEGDVYNATDTGANYVYVGEGQGDDESGWDKLSETVDLSGYLQSSVADTTYVKVSEYTDVKSKVESLTEADNTDIDALFEE